MKLIIAGSRTVEPSIEDIDREVAELVARFRGRPGDPAELITEVVSGGATGADRAGEAWAKHRGIALHVERITDEDVQRHGKYLAPKMRNRRMAERGEIALVFWDGESGGSADMCTRMVARRKLAIVVPTRKRPARGRGQRESG